MKADAYKIVDDVYWVGVLDWDIRDYHGYTLNGTTYNCYLVFGEDKVALIDNVYPGKSEQFWGRIKDAFEKEGREFKIDVVIQNHIEKHNVTFYLSNTAKEVKENSVILADGTELNCDVLIMAVGVRPNISIAKDINIKINRGIVVDKYMQTSIKDIYAAGDCVESFDVLSEQNKILALWPNAFVQGKLAGSNMAGVTKEFTGAFPLNAIGFFGLHLISAGIVDTKQDGYKVYIQKDDTKDLLKKLVIKDDKLEGFVLINTNERAGIYTSLINDKTPLSSLNYDITKQNIGLNVFSKDIRENKIFGGI